MVTKMDYWNSDFLPSVKGVVNQWHSLPNTNQWDVKNVTHTWNHEVTLALVRRTSYRSLLVLFN